MKRSVQKKNSYILVVIVAAILLIFAAFGVSMAQELTPATPQGNEGVKQFQQSQDDLNNQQRSQKDSENRLRDWQREVNDIKRTVKSLDTTGFDKIFSDFSACIAKGTPLIGTQSFWDNNNECNYMNRDVEDALNGLRSQRQCGEIRRNIENRRKEKKSNFDRQTKDILRNDKTIDLTEFNSISVQIDASFTKADALLNGQCTQDAADSLNDANRDLDGLFQDGYNLLNDLQQKSQEAQRAKQISSEIKNYRQQCKDMTREFKNYDKEFSRAGKKGVAVESNEGYLAVKEAYVVMCDATNGAIAKMEAAVKAGDVDAFEETRSIFNDNQQGFWEQMNDSRSQVNEERQRKENLSNVTRELEKQNKELSRMKKQVEKVKKQYAKAVKKQLTSGESKQAIAEFAVFINRFSELTGNIENGLAQAQKEAQEDPESYWFDRGDEVNEYKQEFYDLQHQFEFVNEMIKMLGQTEKEIKLARKELDRYRIKWDSEQVSQAESLLQNANNTVKKAWGMVIGDPESAKDVLESLQEVGDEWDEIMGREVEP